MKINISNKTWGGVATHRRSTNVAANTAIVAPASNTCGIWVIGGYVSGASGVGLLADTVAPTAPTDATSTSIIYDDGGGAKYLSDPIFLPPGLGLYDSSLSGSVSTCHVTYKVL